jgi:hypothetical protein
LHVDPDLYIMQRHGTEAQSGLVYVLNNLGNQWSGTSVKTKWTNQKFKPVAWDGHDTAHPDERATDAEGNAEFPAPPRGPASYVLAISGVSFPINESAQMSGVLALSNDDLATHIKAINEHRKAIDHRQRSMRMTSRPCSIWPMMKTTTLKTVLRF